MRTRFSGLGNSSFQVAGPPAHQPADPNKPATFEQAMVRLNAECDQVMIKKQLDYGNLNIAIWDVLGVAVRLTDKVMRLRELILSGHLPQNESIRDTAVDIRNYGLILLMLIDGLWGLPMEVTQNTEQAEGLRLE
jgi:hypothetical protein